MLIVLRSLVRIGNIGRAGMLRFLNEPAIGCRFDWIGGVGFDLAKQLGADWRVEEPKIIDSLKQGEERPQGFPNRAGNAGT